MAREVEGPATESTSISMVCDVQEWGRSKFTLVDQVPVNSTRVSRLSRFTTREADYLGKNEKKER